MTLSPRRFPIALLVAIAVAAIAALIVSAYFKGGASRGVGPGAITGQVAQSFTLDALDGGRSSLAAYRGRVVFMNLWATWCPPCRAEMPDLQRFYQRYKSQGVAVVGIDQGESATTVRMFARSLGVRYPILLDTQQQYGRVYQALGLPTTVIVSPLGMVVKTFDGALSYDQMVAAVKPLIAIAASR